MDYLPVEAEYNGRDPRTGLFLPGNAGGPGRPKLRPLRDEIRRQLDADPAALRDIVENLIDAARGRHSNRFGEIVNSIQASEFIRDTVEGRPTQSIEVSGEGQAGIVVLEAEVYGVICQPKPGDKLLGSGEVDSTG